jgi:hypothetical protein
MPSRGPLRGALPDGTDYSVELELHRGERVTGISAAIVYELPDGTRPVVGITTFSYNWEASLFGESFAIEAGDWIVRVQPYSEFAARVGVDPIRLLEESVTAREVGGLPVLELAPPLGWGDDDELPLQMEVMYETVSIQRGCGELAVACSQTGAVQVIPLDRLVAPAPEWDGGDVWIGSSAPRPPTNPTYLDPGPLAPRGNHDVLWTGSEMIVWGGSLRDSPAHLVDGAALDPETSTWRVLPSPPLEPTQPTRAVWAGDELVVISPEATVGYDPSTDTWRQVAEGANPPLDRGFVAWTGERVVVWRADVRELDPVSGTWTVLPDTGWGMSRMWENAMVVFDDSILLTRLAPGMCEGREFIYWTGSEWQGLPPAATASLEYADCAGPHQIAAVPGGLLIWEDRLHPTLRYHADDNAWVEAETTPLHGSEGAGGALGIDDRNLVPDYGRGAIYDGGTGDWTPVVLPGDGHDLEMVWTGSEVLMWGATCCYGAGAVEFTIDAWRWTPPG